MSRQANLHHEFYARESKRNNTITLSISQVKNTVKVILLALFTSASIAFLVLAYSMSNIIFTQLLLGIVITLSLVFTRFIKHKKLLIKR